MAGKNSQIHIILETDFKKNLKREAENNEISLSELCRQKLKDNSQLTNIEFSLDEIKKKLGIYKKPTGRI